MNKNKRRFWIFNFALIAMLALVLTGCGSKKKESKDDGKEKVTFWHPYGNESSGAIDAVIKEFEKQNPDISVNSVYIANQGEGQNEKLLTAIAGGTPPDVAYFDRFEISTWASQGSLEDLTEMAKEAGITKEQYYPFSWEEASYDDKLYGIPTTVDARLIYYHKDHFKEVGLDPENPPKTIAELEDAAEKLTIKDGKKFERIGFIPWYAQGWFYGWGWAFGGDFYNAETKEITANDPKNIEAMQWLTDFAKKYNVEDIAGFTDSQGQGAMDPFLTGQISMKVDGNFGAANIEKYTPDLDFGVFPMPTPTGEDHTTWSGGWSVVMPKGAKNKEAGHKLLAFFGSQEGQEIYNEVYTSFSAMDVVNEKIGYKDDPVFKHFIDLLPVSNSRPVMAEGSLYWNELATAVENSIRGIGTPAENLKKVNDLITKEAQK